MHIPGLRLLSLLFLAPAIAFIGCSSDGNDNPESDVDVSTDSGEELPDFSNLPRGEQIYRTPGIAGNNSFACATCHALEEPAEDGILRPGHAIGDATRRSSFKNGQIDSFRAAVNTCIEDWMIGDAWEADNADYLALKEFLDGQTTGDGSDVEIQIVAPPTDPTGGDAEMGRSLFNRSCSGCHAMDGAGTTRGPSLQGRPLERGYIATRIRLGGPNDSDIYDGLSGGIMPFWGADRISNEELLNLVAFVYETSREEPMMDDPDMSDMSDMPDPDMPNPDVSECGSTHPRVGWTGEITGQFHNVGGTAVVVDDCTVEIQNFTFDGGGIDVRWYAAQSGDFRNGFAVSPDIFGTAYTGETYTITLPQNVTLDDFDSLSVWCVDVGTSFGDGTLAAP